MPNETCREIVYDKSSRGFYSAPCGRPVVAEGKCGIHGPGKRAKVTLYGARLWGYEPYEQRVVQTGSAEFTAADKTYKSVGGTPLALGCVRSIPKNEACLTERDAVLRLIVECDAKVAKAERDLTRAKADAEIARRHLIGMDGGSK